MPYSDLDIDIMAPGVRRPVRVGGASGGFSDRVRAISSLAANEDVDVIVGDWLSEVSMPSLIIQVLNDRGSRFNR